MTTISKEEYTNNSGEITSLHIEKLDSYARATVNSIIQMEDNRSGLPYDRIETTADGQILQKGPTSPANFGLYAASIQAAEEMGIIEPEHGEARVANLVSKILAIPEGTGKYKGLLLNWFNTDTCQPAQKWPNNTPVPQFVSSVDNAILALELIAARQKYPALERDINAILNGMQFDIFRDENNFVRGRINLENNEPVPESWCYDVLNTDGFMAAMVGIAMHKFPDDVYKNLGRKTPGNKLQTKEDQDIALRQNGIVRSWNGTSFEPGLRRRYLPETKWARNSYGVNADKHMLEQILYGQEHHDGHFGYSSCYDENAVYDEFGLQVLGMKPNIPEPRCITPHAAALGLDTRYAKQCIENLMGLEQLGVFNPTLGFPSGVALRKENGQKVAVANKIHVLIEQAMIATSIAQFFDEIKHPEQQYHGLHKYTGPQLEPTLMPFIANDSFQDVLVI